MLFPPSRLQVVLTVSLLGIAGPALAQLGIRLDTDRAIYLAYEPVRTRVTLRNYSGNTLVFDSSFANQEYLTFQIEDAKGLFVSTLRRTPPDIGDLVLGAGETKQLDLVLNSVYDLQKPGHYRINATVSHPRLRHAFRTEAPLDIEVREGIRIWTRTAGLPRGDAAGDEIPSRTFSLLLLKQEKDEVYCLQVEDEKMVYAVVRLGPRISSSRPECDLDALSNLHLLLQLHSRIFTYRVFDCNGVPKQSKYYSADDSIPRLDRDPDIGRIMVVGGRVAVEGADFQIGQSHEDEWRQGQSTAPPVKSRVPTRTIR